MGNLSTPIEATHSLVERPVSTPLRKLNVQPVEHSVSTNPAQTSVQPDEQPVIETKTQTNVSYLYFL